jgi:hypothetical protein
MRRRRTYRARSSVKLLGCRNLAVSSRNVLAAACLHRGGTVALQTRLYPVHHASKDQPPFGVGAKFLPTARLEFGLSYFLFGSFSALGGSKHGIPRLPPPTFKQRRPRRVCSKQDTGQNKKLRRSGASPKRVEPTNLASRPRRILGAGGR